MKTSTAQMVGPVLGLDEIMKLADAYAYASFEQGLDQVVDTQIPEQRRDALYAAIDANLTSNTAPQEPAVNAELLAAAEAAWNCIGELPPTQARVEVAKMLTEAITKAGGSA